MKLALETLNQCSEEDFIQALSGVFEHSDWVARQAVKVRPFQTLHQLHTTMFDAVRQASEKIQKEFLCAHPELAGREAQQGSLTLNSELEQSGGRLHALSAAEMQRMTSLNASYRTKHGFPFIICVPQHTKVSLFENFEQRLHGDSHQELREALAQIEIITRLRLERLLQVT
jgi:2-oxo-4-hydroxy-4-carboxy-5-ureidoimidazoline decarboxylase